MSFYLARKMSLGFFIDSTLFIYLYAKKGRKNNINNIKLNYFYVDPLNIYVSNNLCEISLTYNNYNQSFKSLLNWNFFQGLKTINPQLMYFF